MIEIRYYLPDFGQTVDNAYCAQTTRPFDPEWAAEDAADNYHSNHDGWEAKWPLKITVVLPDDPTEHSFIVDREAVPEFHARRID